MNKAEILEKRRKENFDEGKEFLKNKGSRFGTCGIFVAGLIVAIYNMYIGLLSVNNAVMAICFIYLACNCVGTYFVNRKVFDLVLAIVEVIIGIAYFIQYVSLTWGQTII